MQSPRFKRSFIILGLLTLLFVVLGALILKNPVDSNSGFPVTEAEFNRMFPDRISFYEYSDLIEATLAFPKSFNQASRIEQRQEAAAFLANVAHETGFLQATRESDKSKWTHYCAESSKFPCVDGRLYYGRGPLQISWNYNYGAAGEALNLNLLEEPDLVAQDAKLAWLTALWFWSTQKGAAEYSPHQAMIKGLGFGETIRAINGSLECSQPQDSQGFQRMNMRINNYLEFTQILGVPTGEKLGC